MFIFKRKKFTRQVEMQNKDNIQEKIKRGQEDNIPKKIKTLHLW